VRPIHWGIEGRSVPYDDASYNALHDALTGLYNHSAFNILFRDSDKEHLAILIADVDNYDAIKQQKGAAYANKLLCRVADVMKSNFRSVDFLCRLTEKEFVVIISRVTKANKEPVLNKIENINKVLKKPWEDLEPIELTVGIAFSDKSKPDSDVFQDADTALQRMKEIKESGYSVF